MKITIGKDVCIAKTEEYSADWVDSDNSPCDPCNPQVNENGVIQCPECRTYLEDSYVPLCLIELYGSEAAAEYRKLREIKRLLHRGDFRRLNRSRYVYNDKDGKPYTERFFYGLEN